MRVCEGCHSLAHSLFAMPNGQDLCDYCSQAFVKAQEQLHKPKTKRVYNDTKYFLKAKYGTITAWSKSHGFNPVTVSQILNRKGHYTQTDEDDYTNMHVKVFTAMIRNGLGDYLINDGYITEEWL